MARILIAEDEPDIRALIEFTLTFGGHEVFAYSNGGDAVEQAIKQLPDLILLDVRMPRLTGYEACQVLKKDEKTKDIPVVFLSAKGQEAEVDEGLAAGAVAYILKPFAPDHLISQLKKILAEHASGQTKDSVEPEVESPPAAEEKAEAAAASLAEADAKKPDGGSPVEADTKKPDADSPGEADAKKPDAVSPAEADAKKPDAASPTEIDAKKPDGDAPPVAPDSAATISKDSEKEPDGGSPTTGPAES